ncbi:2-oxoglutarate (2OG) and Fe(II)-dependent oxygenase superfamily protein [Arabidopsis thaliana]|uniref:2-oxoglutarate (2OG) and Fe(II)-dependent oxygenase superfamily protein n=1 Tax=Arabidopsis thaliana TaxID=3702 RepID=A0A1I9LM24_ARATH|nr:2-oxoglutarate (2OG) and Fe(II)-dependent oxygenase superfamily protein [Arabidopsis thaliana]ANM63632.1 2-oxoglutarate (2OG) and Fe(II)-dependent oxygenase superfamily protein [Arabidopsis thaliana]|eukprot:NP_001325707.1 2-oxoglutarate (2OG) and Fe(II)-dependent oxygenase superfamily protein [Arabidopsis thaliana]
MAFSSAHLNHHQPLIKHGGATAAPPPTPSCSHLNTTSKSETAVDALSSLFHRLPPLLSLPNRRSIPSLPMVSLSAGDRLEWDDLISAVTDFGYFQLINDDSDILFPPGIAEAAESDSLSLLELSEEKKESSFPKKWPLGYEADAETPSFCLDADCSTDSSELNLSSLREFTRTLEKVGLKTVEMLANALGFGYDSTRFNTLMWVNQGVPDDEPEVWRNGEVKRVKYRPVLCSGQKDGPVKCVTMTLMLTLPMDSMVSSLKDMISDGDKEEEYAEEEEEDGGARSDERRAFRPFSFKEYAWRVYQERLFFRDPLDRYRIKSLKD